MDENDSYIRKFIFSSHDHLLKEPDGLSFDFMDIASDRQKHNLFNNSSSHMLELADISFSNYKIKKADKNMNI